MGSISPIKVSKSRFLFFGIMKLLSLTLLSFAAAEEKKVPPKHPLQRLNTLENFAIDWLNTYLLNKQARNWGNKIARNTQRYKWRFERCGFFDASKIHGGPKRRSADDSDDILDDLRLSNEPNLALRQIFTGYRKWAERYIANDKDGKKCKFQPEKQQIRSQDWHDKISALYSDNQKLLLA